MVKIEGGWEGGSEGTEEKETSPAGTGGRRGGEQEAWQAQVQAPGGSQFRTFNTSYRCMALLYHQ